MNDERKTPLHRIEGTRGRGLLWGLILITGGGFWLLGNVEAVPEPARIILPALLILWGIATLIRRPVND